jgi:hypothetical protein
MLPLRENRQSPIEPHTKLVLMGFNPRNRPANFAPQPGQSFVDDVLARDVC